MKKQIFVSDLDGTLLNNDMKLSGFSKESLINLLEKGINFTVASARSISSIKRIFKDIPLKLPVIESNGAYVSDFESEKHLIINEIGNDLKNEIYDLIRSYDRYPFLTTFNGIEDKLYYKDNLNIGEQWYVDYCVINNDHRLSQVDQIEKKLDEHVICFTIIDRKENIEILAKAIYEQYKGLQLHLMEDLYNLGWFWFTIHDKKASKDQAILELIKLKNLSDYELTVFGDNYNDIAMFEIADKSIATKNGVIELKEMADHIIDFNYNDSVVKYLLKQI